MAGIIVDSVRIEARKYFLRLYLNFLLGPLQHLVISRAMSQHAHVQQR